MNATEELPRGQQLLLQRLIASHCVSDKEANRIFDSLAGGDYMDEDENENEYDEGDNHPASSIMGPGIDSLKAAFVSINRQLKPGFGLEIITMVDTSGSASTRSKHYHAVVNTTADEIAKSETVFSKSWNPHERAFVRLVIRALVDQCEDEDEDEDDDNDDDDDDDEEGGGKRRGKKPSSIGIRRADLINIRSDLEGGFKLTLDQATRVIGILLEEKWLRTSGLTEKNRRDSVQATIELAPRSYLELYHYITGLGMAADKLPQFLYHRD
uniref:Non-structural maintenance of chromosomes element 1 homolog n=1 Tax=Pseudo-nitzschia australis TaxID=44445 RepID=A0A7S4AQI4_9STRA|mmetsp:Transcript_28304/g.59294  ORF Transcript_28304/g.59294 Transcript_28304/m.59294 type:complete len:269 (-) Transcript_28304:358-1164(-)|eukprot:CAMPEP_0168185768 /NCGR_PEP_ID=MMETSP0139_2-20121125/14035_1 /TAXON_ID=44445 /ORGANISM="Pseudo-nitzschia australis, Strain 10249 10 AB" /LENGTH=268 /DNA_ID=CAMNT_0008107651 /DNA_START=21 /DNA_END=827 /DNA_ORIENTATION=+